MISLLFSFQLFSSFYVYGIAEKLSGAEKILIAMGYERSPTNQTSQDNNQELRIKGEVDIVRVAKTAADLVILRCDLELLRGNARSLAKDSPDLEVKLSDILLARGMEDQTYVNTYDGAIAMAANRQYPPPSVPERPRIVTAGRYNVPEDLSAISQGAGFDENRPPPLPERQRGVKKYSSPRKSNAAQDVLGDVTQLPAVLSQPPAIPERQLIVKHSPTRMANNAREDLNNVPQRYRSAEDLLEPDRYHLDQGYKSAPCERVAHNNGQYSSTPDHNFSQQGDQYCSAPVERGGSGNISVMPEHQPEQQQHLQRGSVEGGKEGRKESWESSITSPMSVTSSILISSFPHDLPRPDPNDLPEPVFDDETGFDKPVRFPLHYVSSSEMPCEDNRVSLYVNPSSTSCDPLLFSPDDSHLENNGKGFCDHLDKSDPATTNIAKTVLNHQLAKQASTGDGIVEQNLLQDKSVPLDGASDSIESDGKKSVASPLNSIGEKRKRDSPFTSLSDDAVLQKTSSRTSIGEVVVGRDGRTGGTGSLEDAEKMEGEGRPRSNHLSEKRREDYTQNRKSTAKEEKEKKSKGTADAKEFEKGVNSSGIGKSSAAVSHNKSQSKDQWVCSYCTLINSSDCTICDVCNLPRQA